MKPGFIILAGLVILLYLASRRTTTQTAVTIDYGTAAPSPAASELDKFFSTQLFGDAQRVQLGRGDDETAWLQV